jgi:hypothetical protein
LGYRLQPYKGVHHRVEAICRDAAPHQPNYHRQVIPPMTYSLSSM